MGARSHSSKIDRRTVRRCLLVGAFVLMQSMLSGCLLGQLFGCLQSAAPAPDAPPKLTAQTTFPNQPITAPTGPTLGLANPLFSDPNLTATVPQYAIGGSAGGLTNPLGITLPASSISDVPAAGLGTGQSISLPAQSNSGTESTGLFAPSALAQQASSIVIPAVTNAIQSGQSSGGSPQVQLQPQQAQIPSGLTNGPTGPAYAGLQLDSTGKWVIVPASGNAGATVSASGAASAPSATQPLTSAQLIQQTQRAAQLFQAQSPPSQGR